MITTKREYFGRGHTAFAPGGVHVSSRRRTGDILFTGQFIEILFSQNDTYDYCVGILGNLAGSLLAIEWERHVLLLLGDSLHPIPVGCTCCAFPPGLLSSRSCSGYSRVLV